MTADKAFLLPVVIDDTREDDERVPDKFRDLHWARLPEGDTAPAFVERVRGLVSPTPSHGLTTHAPPAGPVSTATPPVSERVRASWRSNRALPVIAAVVAIGALAYLAVDKSWVSKQPAPPPQTTAVPASAAPAAFNPPPHSIAVLPFVNMSGDKEQEYFSDGLTEELINSLSRINELQVSARTSSFSFKGKDTDISTIAHKLDVASILEGSVRRSAHTVRVTAQLNNAITGYHLWSQTYDRDFGDMLKIQTDIANAVASALKVTLLGDVAAKIELGGTRNPAAFDPYLRGLKADRGYYDEKGLRDAVAGYSEAIRLDPDYALAYANRSLALSQLARNWEKGAGIRDYRERARVDARKAIALAPDLADGHLAFASLLEDSLEFTRAKREYEQALALAPGDAKLLRYFGKFAVEMGQIEAGLAAAHRAVVLDPLNPLNHLMLGRAECSARRYDDALLTLKQAKALAPDYAGISAWLGYAYYLSGDFQGARQPCESAEPGDKEICLAMVYNKLGLQADAETILAKLQADWGDSQALFYAMIYAQWGDTARALDWLDTAMRLRDPYLEKLKTNAIFDPLRNEPRFHAIERELNFPQ
jgi:TolB-like protein